MVEINKYLIPLALASFVFICFMSLVILDTKQNAANLYNTGNAMISQGRVVQAFAFWGESGKMAGWGIALKKFTWGFAIIAAVVLFGRSVFVGILLLAQILVLRIEKSEADPSHGTRTNQHSGPQQES